MAQTISRIKQTESSLIPFTRNKEKYKQSKTWRALPISILLFIGIAIASVGCSKRSDQDVPQQIEHLLQKAKKARKEGQEFSSIAKFYRAAFELKREEMKEREVHAGKNSGIGPCTLLEYEGFVHNYEQFANAASSLSSAIIYVAKQSTDEELRLQAAQYLFSIGLIEISHALLNNVAFRLHNKACSSMGTWRAVSDAAQNMGRKDLASFIDEYLHAGENATSSSSPEKVEKSEHQKRAEQIFESSSLLKLLITDKPDDGPRYTSVLKKLLFQAITKEKLPNGFLQKTLASLQPSGCLGPAKIQTRSNTAKKELLADLLSFHGNVPVGNSPFALPEAGTLVSIGLDAIAVNGKTAVEKPNNEIPKEAFQDGEGSFFITPLFDSLEKEVRAREKSGARNGLWRRNDMLVIIADRQVKKHELENVVYTAKQAEFRKFVLVIKNGKGEHRVIPLLEYGVGRRAFAALDKKNCSKVSPISLDLSGFAPNPDDLENPFLKKIATLSKNTSFIILFEHYLEIFLLFPGPACSFDFITNYLLYGQQSIQCSFSINNQGILGNLVIDGASPQLESQCLRRWIQAWNVDGNLEGSYRFSFSFPPRKGIPKAGQLDLINPDNPNRLSEKASKAEKNDVAYHGPLYVERDENIAVGISPELAKALSTPCKNAIECRNVENVKASKAALQALFRNLMKPGSFAFDDNRVNVYYEGKVEVDDIVSAVNVVNEAYREALGAEKGIHDDSVCQWQFARKSNYRSAVPSKISSQCLYPNMEFNFF